MEKPSMNLNTKKHWISLGIGGVSVLGVLIILQHLRRSQGNALHFVEDNAAEKNFGAFPPDIPEKQFEEFLFL